MQQDTEEEEEKDEFKNAIKQCFGDPLKAMVTLFYAMIGTFEPKVRNSNDCDGQYAHCNHGRHF